MTRELLGVRAAGERSARLTLRLLDLRSQLRDELIVHVVVVPVVAPQRRISSTLSTHCPSCRRER